MNKDRRKRRDQIVKNLREIYVSLDMLRSKIEDLDDAKNLLEELAGEEQEAYENLPEGLQQTEQGERMSEAADALSNQQNELDGLDTTLTEAIDKIEEIAGELEAIE